MKKLTKNKCSSVEILCVVKNAKITNLQFAF